MKCIITENFKAIRTGQFAQASAGAGEFIFETETADVHAVATILEIASANGLKISSKAKKADAIEQLSAHLETLNLPEVNEMTDTQIVEEVIDAGIAAGQSDDEMLIEIVNRGVSFKSAGKLFKSVMESKGLRVTSKERAEKANEILVAKDFGNPVDENGDAVEITADHVNGMVAHICSEIADTSEKQALAAIRKFAKVEEIELPKTKKGGGRGTGGTSGIIKKVGEFMMENRECDEAAITEFVRSVKEDITDGQLKKYVANAKRMLDFAKAWAS